MSLTSAMYTGVSGLLANSDAMNVIGNNISNVNTVGFKDSRTLFADLLYESAGNNAQIGTGVNVQAVQDIFTQGAGQTTGNVTDLTVQGNGFFALASPNKAVTTQDTAFLSRAGAFSVDNNGYLVNPDGYQVVGTDGKSIQMPTDFGKVTKIDSKGIITYLANDGVTQEYYNGPGAATGMALSGTPAIGVAIVTPSDPTKLTKLGGTLYQSNAAAGIPANAFSQANNQPNGTSEQIFSNTLEGSNVDMATEFVNMIVTQRAYSANSKTITTTDQMTQEVLGLIR